MSGPSVTTLPRTAARWALQHGVARVVVTRAARHGDLQAQLVLDPAVRADPYPFQDRLRAQGPLVQGRLSLLSASHAVCREVLRSEDFAVVGDDDTFLPAPLRRLHVWSRDPRALGPVDKPSLLAVEPPDHTRYRRVVSKVFTARAVEGLRPQVQAVADDLLDGLDPGRPFDLVDRYAARLPVTVIAQILGVPEADRPRLLTLGHQIAASLDLGLPWRQFRQVARGLAEFNGYLDDHLRRLRRHPGDDLLSQLVHTEDEGGRLTDVELRATAGLVLAAGFETTVNLLGSATRLLLDAPDQRALLQAEPGRWPDAVEEALRVESPVQLTGRIAKRDTEVAGRPVAAGRVVTTMLGAANRDPAVFADPHRFDVRRANAREHLAFSGGRHFCLGAALARVEGEVGLRALFDRFPGLAPAPGAPGLPPDARRPTRVLLGWEHLAVVAA